MKTYTRKPTKFNNISGEHIVYDSREEALENGVTDIVGITQPKTNPRDTLFKVGRWVEYSDGRVAQILQTKQWSSNWYAYTVLNMFHLGKSRHLVTSDYEYDYIAHPRRINTSDITPPKVKFVEDWLFGGMPIEKSALKHLRHYYYREKKRIGAAKQLTKTSPFTMKLFAYIVLNGEWFDKLLEQSRPIRERYMNLVQSLKRQGVDDDYVAKRLKDHADGEGKTSLEALKTILVVMEKEKGSRPSIPAEFDLDEKPKTPKQLEPRNGAMDVSEFLENEQAKIHVMELDKSPARVTNRQIAVNRMEEILDGYKRSKAGNSE